MCEKNHSIHESNFIDDDLINFNLNNIKNDNKNQIVNKYIKYIIIIIEFTTRKY